MSNFTEKEILRGNLRRRKTNNLTYFEEEKRKKMMLNESKYIYKVVAKDITGEIAWYYVKIFPSKLKQFLTHKPGDSYNLDNYGVIIQSGYGEEVPEDIRAYLFETYGVDNF